MKKLLIILVINLITLLSIAQTPLIQGKYKLTLVVNDLDLEFSNANFIRVAPDCIPSNLLCGSQIWFITGVRGKPGVYSIELLNNRKYLTWSEAPEIQSRLSLESRSSMAGLKFQRFLIKSNNNGTYQIQPAIEPALVTNDFFLSANLTPGLNNWVGLLKNGSTGNQTIANTWNLISLTTTVVPARSERVVVTPTSVNKLDVDIKTGSDNLEPRDFQNNPQLKVNIKNRNPIIIENINNNQTWPNNSIHRISISLPADVNISDLQSISILRGLVRGWNSAEINRADNWNIDRFTVTATIKTNDRLVKTVLLDKIASGRYPVVRIVYQQFDSSNPTVVTEKTFDLLEPATNTPLINVPVTANAIITATFGTGGDDLRGGNDNIDMMFEFKSGIMPLVFRNVNASRRWGNFFEKTVTKELSDSQNFYVDDIKDVVIRHTGGGGIGADNWHLDKFKLSITKGNVTKILIDRVEAPIHFFTGDSRSKTFYVQQ